MAAEIPQGIPEEIVVSDEYQVWKKEALDDLEPEHPVGPRQRFAPQETSYDNPDRYPGVVRFRTEDGQPFEPGLIGEAEVVDASREYLLLGGQVSDLETRRTKIREGRKDSDGNLVRDGLNQRAEAGWRGTEFEDLNGTGRVLSAIPKTTAKVKDPDALRGSTGPEFPSVAKRVVTIEIEIQEGLKMGRQVMTPEVIKEIITAALEKRHLSREQQAGFIDWRHETLIIDLDVLRELIKRDLVSPESVEIGRNFTLRPDVLPAEKTPKPTEQQE